MRPVLALLIASTALEDHGEPAPPVESLVNGVRNPLAIDRDATRFTWRSVDAGRGETQTAYQILVASSAGRVAAGKVDRWDSGKVDSDKSASVEYAGTALPPATRFWWKVRIWDQTGKPSPYSASAFFDTGLAQNEWIARFIWDGTTKLNDFAYFRKTFSVTHKPNLAKVYVTAHNDYLLYCNGQLLGRGPARCDPYCYGQYNAYDVTKLLKTGSNVLAAVAHWQGNWNDSGVNAKPAFLLEARLDYPGGSSSTIGTDESWRVLADTGFIETNATCFGGPGGMNNHAAIQFDSRREPAGWQKVGFDDSRWPSATVVNRSDYHLFAQMAPAEHEQAELKPVSIKSVPGAWLTDFGRCIDGWPKLTMRANRPGDVVRVEYFEMTGERSPAGWDQYSCHGGTETWKPDFGRHATFQVLKITGYAGALRASDVRGIWAYCDVDAAGRFLCSSELLNAIYGMCVSSARQNVQQGMISVDANREQSSWLADSWNIGNVLLYGYWRNFMGRMREKLALWHFQEDC
jgi:alpha-L-rhamnosidase